MSGIIAPVAFNERFTIYLNAEGKPVQRTLREMTGDEVLLAVEWSHDEADRLDAEAEPARAISRAIQERRLEDLRHLSREEIRAAPCSCAQSARRCNGTGD